MSDDAPNIPVYRHAFEYMDNPDAIVAVQANSPTIEIRLVERAKQIMKLGCQELLTCHTDYKIYGSIWAMTKERLESYGNPYNPKPEVLLIDNSIDIHIYKDFKRAENGR